MIKAIGSLKSVNDGTAKSVSVVALKDGTAGMETLQFTIIDQHVPIKAMFEANQTQTVIAKHTATGQGLVIVSSPPSAESAMLILDVDKQPGDDGL